ncbi:MAG: 3-dehydroquinate dehydratase, type II [Proteiniphilum acetatigenes]|uniref:3-dehydroquinate dehydratase n=1 Tax=Proteiniphilum acetatigenes TaxID=294710 RepID=A0A124FXJ4_9BACT|nr:MAG: 3-dehydroquinate dehydratase, type II [Proteiniphilum acetatigenes]
MQTMVSRPLRQLHRLRKRRTEYDVHTSIMKIQIINGPNLNLLGLREPEIYGGQSFEACLGKLQAAYPAVTLTLYQSNVEGELINKIQEAGYGSDGIILNAGGYTHTSVAIRDAIKAVPAPVVEVHISNVYAREDFRHHSMLSAVCRGVIAGFGLDSYRLALEALLEANKK